MDATEHTMGGSKNPSADSGAVSSPISRRLLVAALAAGAVPFLSQGAAADLDAAYRQRFSESSGGVECSTIKPDRWANASFNTEYLNVDLVDVGTANVYDWGDEVGLGLEVVDGKNDARASVRVGLSLEEARRLRDDLSLVLAAIDTYGQGPRPGE